MGSAGLPKVRRGRQGWSGTTASCRRQSDLLAACQGGQVGLLDLDVQQAQRVQAQPLVGCNLVVEAVRPPGVREEDDGDGLHACTGGPAREAEPKFLRASRAPDIASRAGEVCGPHAAVPSLRPGLCQGKKHLAVAVELQAAGPHGAQDGGVVGDLHGDARRARPQLQVRVRGGPARRASAQAAAGWGCLGAGSVRPRAGGRAHPRGSPTTRKATSCWSAPARIWSACCEGQQAHVRASGQRAAGCRQGAPPTRPSPCQPPSLAGRTAPPARAGRSAAGQRRAWPDPPPAHQPARVRHKDGGVGLQVDPAAAPHGGQAPARRLI